MAEVIKQDCQTRIIQLSAVAASLTVNAESIKLHCSCSYLTAHRPAAIVGNSGGAKSEWREESVSTMDNGSSVVF